MYSSAVYFKHVLLRQNRSDLFDSSYKICYHNGFIVWLFDYFFIWYLWYCNFIYCVYV